MLPQSLDQIERAALDFIRAVDGEIDLPMLRKGRERDARRPRLCRRWSRGGNAEKVQTLPMAPSEGIDSESCGRAGAEPDDHAILDQFDRCLHRRTLEGVSIGVSREWSRAHG
jgi:hypothetical protein